MRRVITLALMTVLCFNLLCGCSPSHSAEKRAQEIREEMFGIQEISMIANISADYIDRVFDYKVRYTQAGSSGEIELLSPESVSGLKAKIVDDDTYLSYDGAELATGPLDPDGLSPIGALPLMIRQWQTGHVYGSVCETVGNVSCVLITYSISDTVLLNTWFEIDSGLPITAEIISDSYSVIKCSFENIIIS